jgi:hypothetical protein
MTRPALYVLALAALAGCGGGSETRATADSAGRDVELAPVPGGNALNDRPSGSGGGSAPAAPARPAALTLAAGSTIAAELRAGGATPIPTDYIAFVRGTPAATRADAAQRAAR